MLTSLFIKDYALIDELSVEFSHGLVIITGETGAGKSIIIDALSLVLGERASIDVVRTGSEKGIVEAVFNIAGNKKVKVLLQESGIELSDELIVRREISIKGQSRCFVNDSPASLAVLKQVGEMLVDLHGQHEHQSLLRVNTHIDMLDDFAGLDEQVDEFQVAYKKLVELTREVHDMRQREQQLKEKRDLYQFQIQEIDAVGPHAGEEGHLEAELKILENAEKLASATNALYELLYQGERSVRDLLVLARNQLGTLVDIDRQFKEAVTECSSAEAIVSELAKFIQRYNASVEFNTERLEQIRDRLGRLTLLKKKYGGTVESVVAHREKIGSELSLVESFDDTLKKFVGDIDAQRKNCGRLAQQLSVKRRETGKKVDKAIVGELAKLGIPNGQFTTRVEQTAVTDGVSDEHFAKVGNTNVSLNAKGCDRVEFLISTNIGEDVKPLARVASGGEVSRVMLALKSVLAKSDRLPVMIFDEIDVGVSGRVAQAVGLSMKSLAASHQVIAITHLPQIAGLADSHYVVFKSEDGTRAKTSIRKLSLDERVREVAKLMSGAEVTEAGLKGARELMEHR